MLKNYKWIFPGAVPLMFTLLLIVCRRLLWPAMQMNWLYLLVFVALMGWNMYALLRQIRSESSVFQRFVQLIVFLLLSIGLTITFYCMMEAK